MSRRAGNLLRRMLCSRRWMCRRLCSYYIRWVSDYLYRAYREKRNLFLRAQGRVSEYNSENLIHSLIREVLTKEEYIKLDISGLSSRVTERRFTLRDNGSPALNRFFIFDNLLYCLWWNSWQALSL